MANPWHELVSWLRIARERYIVRLLLSALAFMTLIYSGAFYVLMRVYEDRQVSFWDSLYWTVNRLTTTGEFPLNLDYSAPALETLSMIVQISGISFAFSAFPLVILPALERRIRGAPLQTHSFRNHIVILGYSPIVESLIGELAAGSRKFLVVDNDLELMRRLQAKRVPAIFADPTDEEALVLADADKASYIIANRESEEDNAKIVLASRAASGAEIFTMVDNLEHAHYFRYAGANQVLSPKRLLGTYLAQKAAASWKEELYGANALAPGYYVVELPVYPGSPFDGLCLREAEIPERSGATLIGIWHRGKLEIEPGPRSRLSVENVLIAVGTREQLAELQKLTQTINLPDVTVRRHFVIAGFGDVGRAVKEVLDAQDIVSTIIDPRPKVGEYIQGDATDENALKAARIEEASTFIVASHLDRDNIFSTLVARKLNPDLHILARANSTTTTDNLYRAGADFVFSLSTIAAQMLAEMLIGDGIITLAEGIKVMPVDVPPRLVGRTIGQLKIRSKAGCTVVACLQAEGALCPNPRADFVLSSGQSIVVMGNTEQLKRYKHRFT